MSELKTTVEKFLKAWQSQNYDEMLKYIQNRWKLNYDAKDVIKIWFYGIRPIEWSIIDTNQIGQLCYDVTVELKSKLEHNITKKRIEKIRLIKENEKGEPTPKGNWGINPNTILRLIS